jgi:hypothetical protein
MNRYIYGISPSWADEMANGIDKEAQRLAMEYMVREERILRRMLYDFMIEHELPMGVCCYDNPLTPCEHLRSLVQSVERITRINEAGAVIEDRIQWLYELWLA